MLNCGELAVEDGSSEKTGAAVNGFMAEDAGNEPGGVMDSPG